MHCNDEYAEAMCMANTGFPGYDWYILITASEREDWYAMIDGCRFE